MRLLFLSTAFPHPADPTRAPYNLRLCEALAVEHDVAVIAPVGWTRSAAWTIGLRSRLWRGSSRSAIYPRFYYPPGVMRGTHGWWLWRSIRAEVDRMRRAGTLDAVISYWTWPDGHAAACAARSAGCPVVMMVGGSDVLVLARRPSARARIARTLDRADLIVAVSENIKNAIAALNIPPERIAVVRRGVDTSLFFAGGRAAARTGLGLPQDEGVYLFLWVGRLERVKGVDLLLDAASRLRARWPHGWRLVVAGDGPLRRRARDDWARRQLDGHVTFTGPLDTPALAQWYRAADALVLSSRSEGTPNVLYEAKACGVPIVATDVGGVREALGSGDVVVPPDDPDALADAMQARVPRPPAAGVGAVRTWSDMARELAALTRALSPRPRESSRSARAGGSCAA